MGIRLLWEKNTQWSKKQTYISTTGANFSYHVVVGLRLYFKLCKLSILMRPISKRNVEANGVVSLICQVMKFVIFKPEITL